RTPVPEELYPTAWVADRTIDYLTSQERLGKPFFAFVSFPDPHHPFNPPGKYWDMYSPDDFELPLPYSEHKNPTPPMRWLEANFRGAGHQLTSQTAMFQDEQAIRESMALTSGMISCIDDNVGRIIAALKESGQFDRTVIIFNSDHGDYLGDYNLLLKGLLTTRGITRVPFIWSDPKNRAAKSTGALASTIDLSATILDRAGLEPYYGIQGRSMLPAIEDNLDHRQELLIEFNDGAPKFGFTEPARVRTLLTRDWRYTIFSGEPWGELYNLSTDPNETNNLWNDSKFFTVRAGLSERLNHHLVRQMDESPRARHLA
ncbi:MAG: sulfatase-like hydrolase/transferase, partial [Albidovulum sp.]|nr:sulfatase-like hydrolase/transferase [Albidovulum sp.]